MPRTNLCGGESKMRMTIGQYITGAMKGVITQTMLALKLGITQPSLSNKLKTSKFSFEEFQKLVRILSLTDEEIITLVRRGRR